MNYSNLNVPVLCKILTNLGTNRVFRALRTQDSACASITGREKGAGLAEGAGQAVGILELGELQADPLLVVTHHAGRASGPE